jgi:hypothetical protein
MQDEVDPFGVLVGPDLDSGEAVEIHAFIDTEEEPVRVRRMAATCECAGTQEGVTACGVPAAFVEGAHGRWRRHARPSRPPGKARRRN